MSPMDEAIRDFLERYGLALSEGDLTTIVACWDAPALVLSDQGVQPVSAVALYRAPRGGWRPAGARGGGGGGVGGSESPPRGEPRR